MVAAPATADDALDVSLRYRSYRNWDLHLPNETWFKLTDGIPIPHAGQTFAVELHGNDLRFDTDGDGKLDRSIKPLVDSKTGVATTRVVLSGTNGQGDPFRYAVRLRDDARGWEWAPGGAMVGTIATEAGPIPVRIIDQDGNGRFDDFGSDAMIVGASDNAMFLSRSILVDGKLRQTEVSADGATLKLVDYSGPTAAIDLSTSFDSKAVLLSAVVLSEDRQHSYDVASSIGPIEIPVGSYIVHSGLLGLGQHRVEVRSGRMEPVTLVAEQTKTIDWGGPMRSEFRFMRQGNQLRFSADAIRYFGDAGEEYANWKPIGKSPEFKIRDADTGVVLEVAILPGSC